MRQGINKVSLPVPSCESKEPVSKPTPLGTTPPLKRWTVASINFLTQDETRRLFDAIDSKRDWLMCSYRGLVVVS